MRERERARARMRETERERLTCKPPEERRGEKRGRAVREMHLAIQGATHTHSLSLTQDLSLSLTHTHSLSHTHLLTHTRWGCAREKTRQNRLKGGSQERERGFCYRSTSLIRKTSPVVPYSSSMPKALWRRFLWARYPCDAHSAAVYALPQHQMTDVRTGS